MSYGKTAFMLMVALALPRAAGALGLGEIHVESALNEPLTAEIDIVGASAEDLSGITAAMANRDTFLRFGIERPAFLSTATFKIVRDSRGTAVLAVRSTEAFTEPLVDMLVDLRWRRGEMIRQYTLLLDPPGFAPATRAAEVLPAPDSPAAHPESSGVLPVVPKSAGAVIAPKRVKVGAGATLRAVARRAGARGNSELTSMMIALFRANPNAFEGNINRLRRGAVLAIPSAAEVSAISTAEVHREFRIQMEAWRGTAKVAGRPKPAAPAAAVPGTPSGEVPVPAEPAAAESSRDAEAALGRRVQTLEKGLSELQDLLDRERDKLVRVQATVLHEEKAAAANDIAAGTTTRQGLRWPVAAAFAFLAGAFGALEIWRRRRRSAPIPAIAPADINAPPKSATFESDVPRAIAHCAVRGEVKPALAVTAVSAVPPVIAVPEEPRRDMPTEAEAPATPSQVLASIDVASLEASYLLESSGDDAETATLASAATGIYADDPNAETMPIETARPAPESEAATVETTKLDYNLVDLDAAAHHVQMPSQLHENVGFKERRTNLVDALKLAIEREPNRRDLRMKLLETYYAAAATNRQGFLELVGKLAGEREKSPREEWDKIIWMGRQIAPDDDLFGSEAEDEDDEDLANCA